MASIRSARIVYANVQDNSRGYPIAALQPSEVTVYIELNGREAQIIRDNRGTKSLATLLGPAKRWELPTRGGAGAQVLVAHQALGVNGDPGEIADRTLEALRRALEHLVARS